MKCYNCNSDMSKYKSRTLDYYTCNCNKKFAFDVSYFSDKVRYYNVRINDKYTLQGFENATYLIDNDTFNVIVCIKSPMFFNYKIDLKPQINKIFNKLKNLIVFS